MSTELKLSYLSIYLLCIQINFLFWVSVNSSTYLTHFPVLQIIYNQEKINYKYTYMLKDFKITYQLV